MSLWSSNRLEQTCPAPSVTMDSHPGTLQTNSPQLINFCLAPLTRHLECTSVCADDYSATNLISRDPHLRQKGFRVEHFIRPPVHLHFYFLVPVSIARVLVQPDLMEGTEARVSIFTSSATTPVPQQQQQQQMVLCGRGAVRAEKNVLVLRNKSFEGKHKGLDAACVLGSHISPNDLIQRSEQPLKQMNNVRLLKLSITQFSGPRPVALKLVEVWGTLGSCCTREEMMAARRATASLRMPTNLVNDVSVYNSNPEHGRRVTVAGQLCQPWEIHPTESGQAVSACVHSGDRKVCNTSMERSEGEGLTPDMTTLPASIAESLQAVRTCTHIRESAHDGTQRPVTLHVQRANRVSSIFPSTYFLGNQQSPCPCGEQPEVNGGPQPIPRVSEASQCSASLSCQDSADWSCKGSHEPSAERYCFKTPCTSTVSASDFGGLAMMQPCKDVNRTGQARDEEGTVRIPEHFLDEITCELMVLPMLLPSGHFVDRSTLEKLHHTDITYGRPPSDPFTGVAFTKTTQPQFSVQLKQQIDDYLSRHEGVQSSLGQTLGSAREIASHLSAEDGRGKGAKRVRSAIVSSGDDSSPPPKKHNLTHSTGEGWKKKGEDCPSSTSSSISHPAMPTTSKAGGPHRTPYSRMYSHSHEVEVAASLDKELRDLFSS